MRSTIFICCLDGWSQVQEFHIFFFGKEITIQKSVHHFFAPKIRAVIPARTAGYRKQNCHIVIRMAHHQGVCSLFASNIELPQNNDIRTDIVPGASARLECISVYLEVSFSHPAFIHTSFLYVEGFHLCRFFKGMCKVFRIVISYPPADFRYWKIGFPKE